MSRRCCVEIVNVLNKTDEQENLLLDVISKITDENLKSTYLNKLRPLLSKQEEVSRVLFNLQLVLIKHLKDLITTKRSNSSGFIIEIKQVKRDIKNFQDQFFKFTQDNDDSSSAAPSSSHEKSIHLEEEPGHSFLQVMNKIHL